MATLVVGASGATGRLLLEQLFHRGQNVRAIVRSPDKLSPAVREQPNLSVIHASLLDLSDDEMANHVDGCGAVASCLGHNMTWKGIFGHPRRLVTDATGRLCSAIQARQAAEPTKFLLMNTAGNSNRDLDEAVSFGHGCVIGMLRRQEMPDALIEPAVVVVHHLPQSVRLFHKKQIPPHQLIPLPNSTRRIHPMMQQDHRDAPFESLST